MPRTLQGMAGRWSWITVVVVLPALSRADDFPARFARPDAGSGLSGYWIWFGSAVTRESIDRDLRNMKESYFSGVTILPVYPLALDDASRGIKNHRFLSPEFLELLEYAVRRARGLKLTVDVALGTGWPYGGPWVTPATGAKKLRQRGNQDPAVKGEEIIQRMNDRVIVSIPTGMQVKRAAIGDEGLVLDHYSPEALQGHLHGAGEKLSGSLRGTGLRSFWCDSLEVFDSNWTSDFLPEFRRLRGYDLSPHLPLLFGDATADARQIRRDYWRTLSEMAAENFYRPLQAWCHAQGVSLKAEPYGQPPVALNACRYVDFPVGEHYEWRMLNATRWAASGGHLFGKNLIETEAWTWTGIPNRFADSLEDLKIASDMHFISGANALMAVSYINAPVDSDRAYWVSYWGPWINERQTWWTYFPYLSRYVQRVSWVLQQGKPVADVALYLPIDDVFAATKADRGLNLYFDVRERLHGKPIPEFGLKSALEGDTPIISTMLNHGYQFECIDSTTLPDAVFHEGRLGMGLGDFKVVVLPGLQGMPLPDLVKLADFVRGGGNLIATRRLPDIAYGTDRQASQELKRLVHEMFHQPTYGKGRAILVKDEKEDLTRALQCLVGADLQVARGDPEIGFVHRRLKDQDYYFVANFSKSEKHIEVTFRCPGKIIEVWDPVTGNRREDWDGQIHLEAFGSRVYRVCSDASHRAWMTKPVPVSASKLSGQWNLRLPGHAARAIDQPRAWTEFGPWKHFSGTGSYSSTFEIKSLPVDQQLILDLGVVREIAEVTINGQTAGVTWKQPHRLEVTPLVKPGDNRIEVHVTNLLINEVLGRPAPDYGAIHKRFGQRFPNPSEWKNGQIVPSGLIGPVILHQMRQIHATK